MYRILIVALILAAPTPASAAGQTSPAEIRRMLQERDREIKAILGDRDTFTDAQREQLKKMINGIIDFETMGSASLGRHWDDLTDDQRSHFVEVFGDIVRSQSLSNLEVYRAPVTYKEITVDGTQAHVVTSTIYKEVPARVEYEMLNRDGNWYITDIVLDDVSTTKGYARSFQSVIRKRGFDSLMKSLEKRRDRDRKK